MKKILAFFIALAMLLPSVYVSAEVQTVELVSNGSFELTDSFGFPTGWDSNGKNLIPNGDFETNYYWNYNNGYFSYVFDNEIQSRVAKLDWNALNKWNAVTMRTDKYGMSWDYDANKKIEESTKTPFPGIPIAWGGTYIPRMTVKYTGDLDTARYIEMELKVGAALSEGKNLDVINVKANTFSADSWQTLGGDSFAFTVPAAADVVSTYTASTPGLITLVNAGRSQTLTTGDYTTASTWTDNVILEKLGRASEEASAAGNKSLKIVGYADGITESWISDPFSVEPGEELTASSLVKAQELAGYVRDTESTAPAFDAYLVFDNGSEVKIGTVGADSEDFQRIGTAVTVPSGAFSAQLKYTLSGTGTVYIDKASVTAEREGEPIDETGYINKLANGSFEQADSHGFPESWTTNGDNILKNGDFENGSVTVGSNWDGSFSNLRWGNVGSTAVEVVETDEADKAEHGNYMAKLAWNKAAWGGIGLTNDAYGLFKLAYGSTYIYRGDFKTDKPEDFASYPITMNTITNGGSGNNEKVVANQGSLTASSEWQEASVNYTIAEKSETDTLDMPLFKRWQFRTNGTASASAVMYVDNLKIEKLGRCDSSDSSDGNNSLKIVAYDDKEDEIWTSDRVPVPAGKNILLSASAKTQGMENGAAVTVNFYNGSELVSTEILSEGINSAAFRTVNKIAAVPAGADSAEVQITVSDTSGTAWIDNVKIGVEATDAFIDSVDYSVDDLFGHNGETVTVGVNVANYANPSELTIVSALYDQSGKMCALDSAHKILEPDFELSLTELNINLPDEDLTYYQIKTMLLRGDGTLEPLCETVKFPSLTSVFTLNNYFQDSMVFQRDEEIPVYGSGAPGEPITAEFNGNTVTAAADSGGEWLINLPAEAANAEGKTLTVSGRGGRSFTINDIVVGDVFIMAGQSNAAFSISEVKAFRENPDPANENIRVLGMYEASNNDALGSLTEKTSLPSAEELNPLNKAGVTDPTWLKFSPKESAQIASDPLTRDTSAVLYYFAKNIYNSLEERGETVPMGLITAAVGGTRIEKWLPAEVYKNNPELTADQDALKSTLYNNMINPLTKLKVKGILWYQGCANAASSVRYKTELKALIESYRARFNDPELPFIIQQLAGYCDPYSLLRDSQKQVCEEMDNVELNNLIDLGEEYNIHPQAKEPVGNRAAAIALEKWYGIANDGWKFPNFTGCVNTTYNEFNAMELSFENVVGGFYTVDENGERQSEIAPGGFLIADDSGDFKIASAVINDDKIIIWNEEVTEPVYVRYAFEGFPYPRFANIYGGNGLPVIPFRNDSLNYEISEERAMSDSSENLLLGADFETVDYTGAPSFVNYFQNRVTNTLYGGVTMGAWDSETAQYGKQYALMSLFNGTGNANTSVYTAVTGTCRNMRLPIQPGEYVIEADVQCDFTDSSTLLYMQAGIYDNNEKSIRNIYTNGGEWLVSESLNEMTHITGTITFDDSLTDCYLYAFGPRLVTKSADVQTVKVDNLVLRRAR